MKAIDTARLLALGTAALLGAAAAVTVARTAPAPAADVSRGTEDAFVSGLHAREIPPRGKPLRWTGARAVVSFRSLPPGPATIDVQVRGQRGPVVVAADGVVLGTLGAGGRATFDAPAGPRPVREVELRTDGFEAGDGRRLGAQLERVSIRVARGGPSAGLIVLFVVPALAAAGMSLLSGSRARVAAATGAGVSAVQCALLWPSGVVYSPYAARLAVVVCAAALASGAWGAFWRRRAAGAGPWAFGALLASAIVQVAVGASPLMVVSDAVFHANNLARVAAGDLFLTSLTQHATPFRFPYGVSFYVMLAPLLRSGIDPVTLVRWGAALAGVAGAAGLFALLVARGPALAALAVVILQLLPMSIDVLSFGNLSNAFAQGLTVLFFAWWAGRAPGSWLLGALVLALAATAHLSAFIVLAVLCPWLAWAHWPELRSDRTRWTALVTGMAVAVAYFASFAPMVSAQLARLGEGGGPAGGSFVASTARQGMSVAGQWGLPVVILALLALPVRPRERFDRDLLAWWCAGGLLLLLAIATPLDVRWVYALGPAAAVAAGTAFVRLWKGGPLMRWAGISLLAIQAGLAAWAAAEALWARYR
jgi:hypothetical protein